ncbi:MAG TPA: hypothetical protein VHZ78_08520 [Rhizomicrobium sp.]|jgi:hypothetical protein|nr:hypothetical protein [Rhizomicrobium sp.]
MTDPITRTQQVNAAIDAASLEEFLNSSNSTMTTRLGNTKPTMTGLDSIVSAIAYQAPVNYTTGLSITALTQTVLSSSIVYAPIPAALPFTTGASLDTSKWYVVQYLGSFPPTGTGSLVRQTNPTVTSPVINGTDGNGTYAGRKYSLDITTPDGLYDGGFRVTAKISANNHPYGLIEAWKPLGSGSGSKFLKCFDHTSGQSADTLLHYIDAGGISTCTAVIVSGVKTAGGTPEDTTFNPASSNPCMLSVWNDVQCGAELRVAPLGSIADGRFLRLLGPGDGATSATATPLFTVKYDATKGAVFAWKAESTSDSGYDISLYRQNVSVLATDGVFNALSFIAGSPTGGNMGSGTVNAVSLFAGGVQVPMPLSAANTGSTNNSASGSGAFINMTPNLTLGASYLTNNKAIEVLATFQIVSGSAPPVLHFQLLMGSTVLGSWDPATPTASQTAHSITYRYLIHSTGAPGASVGVIASAFAATNQTNAPAAANTVLQPVIVATNASQVLQIATKWDTAGTGTNTIQLLSLIVRELA